MKKLFILLFILTSCTITGNVVREFSDPTEVYFCPRENCKEVLVNYFNNSNEINCAMYSLNVPELVNILKNKHARMVMDNDNAVNDLHPVVDGKFALMHNKFCILDNQTVITGSFNPTVGEGVNINNNNVVIFHSKNIAKAYNDEFEELYSGTFSGGKKSKQDIFYLNDDKIEVYFCPEDWCANKELDVLNNAKQSIYFLVYSFTHNKIGDLIVNKKNQGLDIMGVMEKSQSGVYSQFQKFNQSGINVRWDSNKGLMHHKVFIVDRSIVMTGSFNPTLNGDINNDENLVIIHSKPIAERFIEEFNYVNNQ